jgi:superfamily II DNA or RNA helicase
MLRDFQQRLECDVVDAWADGARNVMMTSPTGSGKTVIIGHIIERLDVPTVVIAHRQELLAQLALALNREAVPHFIIAPAPIVRQIITAELSLHGTTYHDPRAKTRVAGVDTLIRRDSSADVWFQNVGLVIIDEGHHVLEANKWGKALAMFPNARGLLPTAHAVRGDRRGLGRGASGVVDRLIIGPDCRSLIDRGFLTDYRFICPSTDVNLQGFHVTESGEYNAKEVRAAIHASPRIVGDIVNAYRKFAPGKLGITFAVDIQSATEIAKKYCASGVEAQIITGETPLHIRAALMHKFRNREIMQLVSVDVLGEGVDVPGVEVISMARPTNSFQLFAQQIGRALRVLIAPEIFKNWGSYTDAERLAYIAASGKPKAIIIDHVQNVLRHGLPDIPQIYTLDDPKTKRGNSQKSLLRTCLECLQPFERFLIACPYCGSPVIIQGRATPDEVDGDMIELDGTVLAALRRELARVDGAPRIPAAAPAAASGVIVRTHHERQVGQQSLRALMALYGGYMAHLGLSLREAQKRYYYDFGIDIISAQILNAKDASELERRIQSYLLARNVIQA